MAKDSAAINNTAIKLNKVNAMLFKIRDFLNIKILKSIYYDIFDCHFMQIQYGEIQTCTF